MAYPTLQSVTDCNFSPLSFELYYITFLILNKDYQRFFILKQTTKQKKKTIQKKSTYKF